MFLESQLCVAGPGGDHLINTQYAAFYHTFYCSVSIKGHVLRHDHIPELVKIEPVPVGKDIRLVVLMDDLFFSFRSIDPQSTDMF